MLCRSQPAGNKIYPDWERGPGGIEPETCRIWGLGPGAWCPFGWILVRGAPFRVGFWCAVRRFLGWILVHGGAVFGLDFGARYSYVVRRFWGRFRCTVRRFWAQFWCTVCGAPFLGSILVRGPILGPIFAARCAFLGSILARCLSWGSILVRGALMFGVDHSQRATRGIEPETCQIWGLGPGAWLPFWVDFGARCAFFGLGFGVRCAVLGWIFGARCAVFGLDFGARCVVRRFSGRFRCTVRRFWAQFWCAVRRFWARFWCAVCGAPISVHGAPFWARKIERRDRGESSPRPVEYGALVLAHDTLSGGFRCTVRRFLGSILGARCAVFGSILVRGVWCADFGADFGARCAFFGSFLVCGAPFLGSILVHGVVWCADFGADFVARCAFLGSILAPCLFGSILGSILVRGALMLGSITASGQQDLSNMKHFAFWRFVGHLLVDLKTSWQPSSKQ